MTSTQSRDLKIYEITNRNTGEKRYSVSDNAQNACKQLGWLIGDCYVNEQKPKYQHGKKRTPDLLFRVPCQVCPYQYAECKKVAGDNCPCQPETPDVKEWLNQATQAHLCLHVGSELAKKDHQLHQKWCPIEQAIEELAPKIQRLPTNQ